MKVEKYGCESEEIFDHYSKEGIFFLKAGYVGETLGEYNITEVLFEDIKKDVLFELEIHIRNYVIESLRRKSNFNAWAAKA